MDRVVKLVFSIVVVILFASGLIAFYTIFMRSSDDVIVPDFRERSIVDAVGEAEKLELVFQVEPVAGNMPDGIVLAQYPAAGEQLRKGQVVILQVSRTGEMKAVPELRKKTLAEAQKQIQASGFILGDVLKIKEQGVKPGTVISQNPAPPEKMMPGRKIDLLVQEGNATDNIIIPDVTRKNEKEARQILETSGLKIQGVERAYSPVVPEGLVIETKPVAGYSVKPGQNVLIKIATQKRPAGFLDENTKTTTNAGATGNGTVRRVTSQPAQNQNQTPAKNNAPDTPSAQPAKNNAPSAAPAQPAKNQNAPAVMNAPSEPKPVPSNNKPAEQNKPAQNKSQPSNSGSAQKTARVRYQVPPLSSPMNLRIELTDPKGKRDILNRQVRSGESVSVQAQYTQECVITIYLGGEFVWQERQR